MPPCSRSDKPGAPDRRPLYSWLLLAICLLFLIASVASAKPPTNAWDLPPLVLPDLQDQPHHLYDWHGKVILLNFWASWCSPCQIELPHLTAYQHRYGVQGLQVIGIGLDRPEKIKNVVRTLAIPYPVLYSVPEHGGFQLLQQWGDHQSVLPYTVVIDRDGTIVFSRIGIFEEEAFERFVLPLLTQRLQ